MKEDPARVTIDLAASLFEIAGLDIATYHQRNNKRIVWARQLAMYWLWTRTGFSTQRIASMMGLKDHTTVIHGRNQTQKRLDTNAAFAIAVKEAEARCGDRMRLSTAEFFGAGKTHKFVFPVGAV
jgi:chromosomal replication initiation ATPase DnaA